MTNITEIKLFVIRIYSSGYATNLF